jgi:hypothetical protein
MSARKKFVKFCEEDMRRDGHPQENRLLRTVQLGVRARHLFVAPGRDRLCSLILEGSVHRI